LALVLSTGRLIDLRRASGGPNLAAYCRALLFAFTPGHSAACAFESFPPWIKSFRLAVPSFPLPVPLWFLPPTPPPSRRPRLLPPFRLGRRSWPAPSPMLLYPSLRNCVCQWVSRTSVRSHLPPPFVVPFPKSYGCPAFPPLSVFFHQLLHILRGQLRHLKSPPRQDCPCLRSQVSSSFKKADAGCPPRRWDRRPHVLRVKESPGAPMVWEPPFPCSPPLCGIHRILFTVNKSPE